MSEGKKKVPEFFIFDRLDELENITLELMEKADLGEPSVEIATRLAKHATIIAEFGLVLTFLGRVREAKSKSEAIALKDSLLDGLRERSAIAERVDVIDKIFCNRLDKIWE
ncbi:hypothetical protein ES703_72021 [subsurface metagenome]